MTRDAAAETGRLDTRQTGYALARAWLAIVVDEIEHRRSGLDDDEWALVHRYYANLLNPATRGFFISHLGRRIGRVADILRVETPHGRILDAACGIGTQALLFAALGYEVHGFDLFPAEIGILEKRRRYYADRFGRALAIQARIANATRLAADDFPSVDVIHIFEALSHIHPMEECLGRLAAFARPGTRLVISDTNGMNLALRYRLYRETGRWTYTVRQVDDPSTGRQIPYAYKRVLSVRALAGHLAAAGFRLSSVRGSGFVPAAFWPAGGRPGFADRVDALFARLPKNHLFSLSYTVSATRTLS